MTSSKYNFAQKFKERLEKQQKEKKTSYNDPRFWKFKFPETKTKSKVIFRFLPDKNSEEYISYYSHNINYNVESEKNGIISKSKRFYADKCAGTIKQDCPVCARGTQLWNSPYASDKEEAKQFFRKQRYISNVLIISDPANPENNGKVFLYDFGSLIYKLIMEKKELLIKDSGDKDVYDDEVGFFPHDFESGANFILKVEKTAHSQDYKGSMFDTQSKMFPEYDGEKWIQKIDEIMSQTYSLDEFLDPKIYPSAENVKKRLGNVLGVDLDDDEDGNDQEPQSHPQVKSKPPTSPKKVEKVEEDDDDSEDSDWMSQLSGDDDE